MDTLKKTPDEVARVLHLIKTQMPNVYKAIKSKAAEIGDEAYSLVRQGVRGEPARFYAIEAGHVVGTPFAGHPIESDVAQLIGNFGCGYVCIWPSASAEDAP